MQHLLLDGAAGSNIGSIVMVGVLIVLMVIYLVFGSINRKKNQEQAMKMLSELKVGDKVVTNAGVYGEIVSQKETDMGKVVVLKTGGDENEKRASYITVNASVILGKDLKKDLILDAEGNVIEPTQELKEEVLKPASEQSEGEEISSEKDDDKIEQSRRRTASRRSHTKTEE